MIYAEAHKYARKEITCSRQGYRHFILAIVAVIIAEYLFGAHQVINAKGHS